MINLIKPAIAYFLCLFATGFVLGTVRVLWAVPRLGERTAELLEMPFILVAILIAAPWINQHYCHTAAPIQRLKIGFIALLFMLIADFGVGVFLRGMHPIEVITSRDAVSGAAYYGMLLVFALMPWILSRKDG
ncbi:MAG: hypothetical protein SNJ57_09565 [Cyanobacteriota bacterium]